jgi:anti-sigma factor (TIGR02949 family)
MNPCDEFSARASRYVQNTLEGHDLEAFRSHLATCENCRAMVQAELNLSQLLRRSRPLYSAPPALRARVAAAVERQRTHVGGPKLFPKRLLRIFERALAPALRVPTLRVVVPAFVVMALILAFVPNVVRQVRAANYVETAVAMHRGYLGGKLPLELQSNSPDQIAIWFTGKLAFSFRLPAAQVTAEGPTVYGLTGASLVSYRGSPAALIIYEKQKERISLLVASSESAVVAGGEEVRSGVLMFHYRIDQGFKVVTWSNHGLSYALVSSVSGSARESCMVCHQSMADHQNFPIRPSTTPLRLRTPFLRRALVAPRV